MCGDSRTCGDPDADVPREEDAANEDACDAINTDSPLSTALLWRQGLGLRRELPLVRWGGNPTNRDKLGDQCSNADLRRFLKTAC